ncbi:MAG TPA: DUF423 domain-containing protein [Opitutaceae bacterium]|jgi:uncharacterized membrane protein YgdD (TMEM256/DUF423 family)
MNPRVALLAGALLGGTGVGAGAFGAHGLHALLMERGMLHAWETGAHYQELHGVALIALAAWMRAAGGSRTASIAVWCWTGGSILFSSSLYLLATGAPHWVGPLTPLGGTVLIAGWVSVALAAAKGQAVSV